MLRPDSTERTASPTASAASLGGRPRTICLVAPARGGVDDAVAQHTLRLGNTLTAAGWRVHVLWCGADKMQSPADKTVATAQWRLDGFEFPATITLDGPCLFDALQESDCVLHVLQEMHAQHHFDAIEFPERGGLGFRSIQAKQTGQAFGDVRLIVTEHGSTAALKHESNQWLDGPVDVSLHYMESYSVEYADQIRLPDAPLDFGERTTPALACTSRSESLVTVCVPYYNLAGTIEETLTSLAWQTYEKLDVVVINDGSTDARANDVFGQMQTRFPNYRYVVQENQGIGATRNRGLQMARGEYFLPVDADNVADRNMVRRFVQGMEHNREIAALTCYFLAFRQFADLIERRFLYAYKPTGGPRVLGCWQNVYGDGNAMFRTEALRAVGGFESDRDTSFEDWEVFVKLVNAGHRVEVLPDILFYYRHCDAGFSRVTNAYRNRQRVLRQFNEIDTLPPRERELLWNWLVGAQERLAELELENEALRNRINGPAFRLVDGVSRALKGIRNTTRTFARD